MLVEQALPIARELYAAVLNDPVSKGPLVLFSVEGGMDIEEVNAATPEKVLRLPIDIRTGLSQADAAALLSGTDLTAAEQTAVASALMALYAVYLKVGGRPG